eukprot:11222248-Lingulodinium_polyedra.AAC.1
MADLFQEEVCLGQDEGPAKRLQCNEGRGGRAGSGTVEGRPGSILCSARIQRIGRGRAGGGEPVVCRAAGG